MKKNKVSAGSIIFVQTGIDQLKNAPVGFFINDETGELFNVDNTVIRTVSLEKMQKAGIAVATKKKAKQAIERFKDVIGPLEPVVKPRAAPLVSPVKPVPGLGLFAARINSSTLNWFSNLAEISDMQEHAFVWRPDGFALKGYVQQDKFVFDIFLNAKDKSVFQQFNAPGPKAAFFYKMNVPQKQKFVDISSSDEKPKGVETVENRLHDIESMVDSAFEYGIEDYAQVEIDANDMLINTGRDLKDTTQLSWYIKWYGEEPMLFIHKDENYIENIKIETKNFKIDKYEQYHAPVPVYRYLTMFKFSPVLDKTTLKLAKNGMIVVECSNIAGSRATFML